ncbi:Golgi apparatus membrane protein TVP38 [Pleurotus pulmonarius]
MVEDIAETEEWMQKLGSVEGPEGVGMEQGRSCRKRKRVSELAMLLPPASRHRASSTSTSLQPLPAATGRRRSNSNLPQLQLSSSAAPSIGTPPLSPVGSSFSDSSSPTISTPSDEIPPTEHSQKQQSNMLFIVAARLFEWANPAQSPPAFDDDLVLPLSASHHQTTFDIPEKPTSVRHAWSAWYRGIPPINTPLIVVILSFPASTLLVLVALTSLPISLSWPRTLSDLSQLGRELHGYSQAGWIPFLHVVAAMSVTAVWKHAWSIPGAVIWNVLAGALFSPSYATILLTLLTTIGSVLASQLAKPLAPFLTYAFPKALAMTRTALALEAPAPAPLPSQSTLYPPLTTPSFSLSPPTPSPSPSSAYPPSTPTTSKHQKQKSAAWVRLSVLRLIGIVPWSGINIACGVTAVPIRDSALGAFIGSLPWTAVTCQIGDILQTLASSTASLSSSSAPALSPSDLASSASSASAVVAAAAAAASAALLSSINSTLPSSPLDATTSSALRDTLTTTAPNTVYTHAPASQTIQTILLSPEILFKLVFLTVLSLAPILGRERLRAFVEGRSTSTSASSPPSADDAEEQQPAEQTSGGAPAAGNACLANANACISNARRDGGAGGSPNGLGNGRVKKRGRHYKRFSSFSMPHFPNLPNLPTLNLPHLPHLPNLPHMHLSDSAGAELPQTSPTSPSLEVRSWREQLRATLGGAMDSVGGVVSGAIGGVGGVGAGVAEVVGGPEWRRRERERELEVLVREKRDLEREV